jgi:hypothetical protein
MLQDRSLNGDVRHEVDEAGAWLQRHWSAAAAVLALSAVPVLGGIVDVDAIHRDALRDLQDVARHDRMPGWLDGVERVAVAGRIEGASKPMLRRAHMETAPRRTYNFSRKIDIRVSGFAWQGAVASLHSGQAASATLPTALQSDGSRGPTEQTE